MGEMYDYTYDDFGRLLTKKIPGQGVISYTYDPFYRIESMTDGNGREQTYHYDRYNRNIETYVNGELVTKNHYDKGNSAGIYRGKIWKTENKTVEGNSFDSFLKNEFTYDQFGRTDSELKENHIGGNDKIGFTYDYMDNILTSSKQHTGYSTDLTINSRYVYDHAFRMESEDIQVNNDPIVRLKENRYNVKDQLLGTGMYGKTNSLLQLVDYDYNSRGWLTRINDVDENGIPLAACKGGGGSTPCETCTKNYTAAKSQSNASPFAIVDAYGGGGNLIPLEYPYPSNQLNKFENDLKAWLIENEFAFETINVSWENGVFQVSALESVFELNSLNISDENGNKSEMLFGLPNGEEFIANENEYCDLCQQFGYDCATCPVWELIEACPACPDFDQQVLELLDCDNCDIGGYGVLPKQLNLKLNPEVFVASEDQMIHWDAATVLYLKDGEGIGFHPAGTYLTGNPLNVVADQSDVYLSFQLPQVIIAKDNQTELEDYIKDKLNEELKQLFVDLEQFDDNLGNRLQALSSAVSGDMMDKISPFAKEVSEKMNREKLTPNPGGPDLPDLDLFKLNLNYQEGHEVSGMPGQYNGNISGMTWQTGNERKRTYGFSYDDLDRLKIARYSDWQINNTWSFDEKFSTSYGYDLDGNFTHILRQGALDPCSRFDPSIYNYGRIDQLSFEYNNQNQLQKVGDESVNYRGFKNGSSTYSYDGMGSLITDGGKGLTVVNNFLNLPTNMSLGAGEIAIKYLATGEKLRKRTSSDQGDTTVDYCGNVEYENGELAAIHHSTGRIIPSDDESDGPFRYQFQLMDHLGNVRILFEDKNQDGSITKINPEGSSKNPFIIDEEEIITINHYYPFGLQMTGPAIDDWYGGANGRKYDYSYNGKELNEDFGLDWSDYGARWYDATIGRWGAVDPLAESYSSYSPYNYTLNNPVLFIDPDGRYVSSNSSYNTVASQQENVDDVIIDDASETAIQSFENIINNGLGGFYTANVNDETGALSLTRTKQGGEMSLRQQNFFKVLSRAIDSPEEVFFDLVDHNDASSSSILFGDNGETDISATPNMHTLDMGDISTFGENGLLTSQGVIAHEIAEGFQIQVNGKNPYLAHTTSALVAESRTNGVRVEGGSFNNNFTELRIRLMLSHETIRAVIVTFKNGNVTNIGNNERE